MLRQDCQNYSCSLDEESDKKAKLELFEDDKRFEAVNDLREWVGQQNKWLITPQDTKFLLSFLRNRKFNQQSTRELLGSYWTARSKCPEWFRNVDPANEMIKMVLRQGNFVLLPGRDKYGQKVLLGRPGAIDPSGRHFTIDDLIKAGIAVVDYLLLDENVQVNGLVYLMDFTNFTLRHHKFWGAGTLKRSTFVWQNAFPMRYKGIHYYNTGPVFDIGFNIIKPFLSQKIQNRIIFHGNTLVPVYDRFDKSMLPDEYLPDDYTGPSAGPIRKLIEDMIEEMTQPETRDFIMRLSSGEYRVDESCRPSDSKSTIRKLSSL